MNKRRSGKGSFYIKGHLLSEKLGGPGMWENMTPLTRSANDEHERKVEKTLKDETDKGKIFEYTVTPQYGRGDNSGSLKQQTGESQDDFNTKKEIAKAENFVPVALKTDYEELIVNTDGKIEKGTLKQSYTVKNTIKQNSQNYQIKNGIDAIPLNAPNLKTFNLLALDIPEELSEIIVANRPYGTRESLVKKVNSTLKTKNLNSVIEFNINMVNDWYDDGLITFTK